MGRCSQGEAGTGVVVLGDDMAAVSAGCAVCRCEELEFGSAEWCLEAIERELVHDIYDEDREAEWWWDARRPLYVQLYRAAARYSRI